MNKDNLPVPWDHNSLKHQDQQSYPFKVFKIVVKHSGKALGISRENLNNGAKLKQWEYYGRDNQQFYLFPIDHYYWVIVVKHSGKVLDIQGLTQNGARVRQYSFAGGDNQQFEIFDVGDGYVGIRAKHSQKVLDIRFAGKADGEWVHQWQWLNKDSQKFKLEPVEDIAIPYNFKSFEPLKVDLPIIMKDKIMLPDRTEPKSQGEMIIPFIYFKDKANLPRWGQAKFSPYYILSRERCFELKSLYKFSGKSVIEKTKGISIEIEKEIIKEKETIKSSKKGAEVGVQYSSESSVSFGPLSILKLFGISAGLSMAVERSLRIYNKTTENIGITLDENYKEEYPPGEPFYEAKWNSINSYILRDINGIEIRRKEIPNNHILICNTWPAE